MKVIAMVMLSAATVRAEAPKAAPGAAALSAGAPDAVTLTSGEVLRGSLIEFADGRYVMIHPILGRLVIPLESVASVSWPAAETSAGSAPMVEAPPPAAAPHSNAASAAAEGAPALPPDGDNDKPRWKSHLEAGASGSWGNTDEGDIRLRFVSTRTVPDNTLKLDSHYHFSTSDGAIRSNDFTAGALSEWPVPVSRWSYFAEGRFDYDQFVSWDYRVSAAAGVGYRLVDLKKTTPDGGLIDSFLLSLRAGAGARREFGSEIRSIQPEGLFGGELKWRLNSRQRVELESTIYPSLRALGEFRLESKASWVLDLDHGDGLSLKVGLTDSYESQTDSDVKHNDLAVYSALVLNF